MRIILSLSPEIRLRGNYFCRGFGSEGKLEEKLFIILEVYASKKKKDKAISSLEWFLEFFQNAIGRSFDYKF